MIGQDSLHPNEEPITVTPYISVCGQGDHKSDAVNKRSGQELFLKCCFYINDGLTSCRGLGEL